MSESMAPPSKPRATWPLTAAVRLPSPGSSRGRADTRGRAANRGGDASAASLRGRRSAHDCLRPRGGSTAGRQARLTPAFLPIPTLEPAAPRRDFSSVLTEGQVRPQAAALVRSQTGERHGQRAPAQTLGRSCECRARVPGDFRCGLMCELCHLDRFAQSRATS